MLARSIFLQKLSNKLSNIIDSIDEYESTEPDFAIIREYAEQLSVEVDSMIEVTETELE